jgi:hypothetical protein
MPFKCQTENEIFFFSVISTVAVTTAMTNQIHDSQKGRVSRPQSSADEKEEKKGFWQIDCQAEKEMAQEHHKNKFAIIHFDLSLGKIGNATKRHKIYIFIFSFLFYYSICICELLLVLSTLTQKKGR